MKVAPLIRFLCAGTVFWICACHPSGPEFDASGSFEAEPVIVSAEVPGRLVNFTVEEGQKLQAGEIVGLQDTARLHFEKARIVSQKQALQLKTKSAKSQLDLLEKQYHVQETRLTKLLTEQERIERLYARDAATEKQMDDMHSQVDILKKEMEVTKQQMEVQQAQVQEFNQSILSERDPLQSGIESVEEELKQAVITNPVTGTVLTSYVEEGEMAMPGKALYKIADLSDMILRAYITGIQLPGVRLGQEVRVFVDEGPDSFRELQGKITWISDEAEFTPKTIQTKEERANLVYAIKIKVPNPEGRLKMGMYGEIKL